MFRGLSSWLGLQSPGTDGEASAGDPPPEQHSEVAAQPTKEQQPEDLELLHQARDLGSESDWPLGGSRWWAVPQGCSRLATGVRNRGGKRVILQSDPIPLQFLVVGHFVFCVTIRLSLCL